MSALQFLFGTTGWIFGPLILAAGLLALGLCLWASRRSGSPQGRRRAVAFALLPLALGVCAVLFGLVVLWLSGQKTADWLALGRACLAGLVVTVVPLAWSLLLLRLRGGNA
jgi:hypothetical protein